jgi:hypothetical protein
MLGLFKNVASGFHLELSNGADKIEAMQKPMRLPKSFTLERSVVSYVQNTRGSRSSSERVNELLRKAILQEQYERLEEEAARFFSMPSETDRAEAKAFQKASIRSLSRG